MLCGIAAATLTLWLMPNYRYAGELLENVNLNNYWIPFVIWANLYAVWNLYHAGAQNFGFFCLYRRRGFSGLKKLMVLAACVTGTVVTVHFLPRVTPSNHAHLTFLLVFGAVTVNHWLGAIGLSSHVWANHTGRSPWIFVAVVLVLGCAIAYAVHYSFYISAGAFLGALGLRAAVGMWHFCQDRWMWKLSDPQVRATIGCDLFH
jgi:hypothetical protein